MKSNLQVLQFVLVEAALVVPADVGVDAAHGEVHLGQPPGGVVALLAVDGDVADAAAVALHERLGLHEHAARAAARVIDAALVRFQHFHQHAHDRAGRVELAAALALRAGEAAEEIFIDAAEQVLAPCRPARPMAMPEMRSISSPSITLSSAGRL